MRSAKTVLTIVGIAFILAFAIAFAILIEQQDRGYAWHTYRAPDGTFSVDLPGELIPQTTKVPISDGKTTELNQISARATPTLAYSCGYYEMEIVGLQPPQETLIHARDRSLSKIEGTVREEKPVVVEGYSGLDLQVLGRAGLVVHERLIVAGDRLYMILSVAPPQEQQEKTTKRVMNSFRIYRTTEAQH
jgi:hypothetical protein